MGSTDTQLDVDNATAKKKEQEDERLAPCWSMCVVARVTNGFIDCTTVVTKMETKKLKHIWIKKKWKQINICFTVKSTESETCVHDLDFNL